MIGVFYVRGYANVSCAIFQEAKIQEEKLEKWMACVPGYESFWAFSKDKKGYSGKIEFVLDEHSHSTCAWTEFSISTVQAI